MYLQILINQLLEDGNILNDPCCLSLSILTFRNFNTAIMRF